MPQLVFSFASARTANGLIAGLPAAARLAREWQSAHPQSGSMQPLMLELRDGGQLDLRCISEIERLAKGTAVAVCRAAPADAAVLPGETLPNAGQLAQWLVNGAPLQAASIMDEPEARRALAAASKRIIKATGKPGDGIVSRWLNRPISQAISARLLRFESIRPGHATALTAIIAAAMFICLVAGGDAGLIVGALLFQGASVVDGVDGEIARTTFRTSARGAMFDSAIDAATNLGFIAGLIINQWQAGATGNAATGMVGLGILIAGLATLGIYARARGEPLNFDGAKKLVGDNPSPLMAALRYITMRDFYCLFFMLMVLLGLHAEALAIFSVAAAIWLVSIINMLAKGQRESRKTSIR